MKVLAVYKVESEQVVADVRVLQRDDEYINTYELEYLHLNPATRAVLQRLKERIIDSVDVKISDLVSKAEDENIRRTFYKRAKEILKRELPDATEDEENFLSGRLMQEMLGLGDLELLLSDPQLEEVIVNSAKENVWVYHRTFGWLKSNIIIKKEEQIQNYSEIIGRKIGRQITTLNPLMDANLLSGNRVNCVLLPISSKGNSIVIRKFRADPWTIVHLIDPVNKTLSAEVAALLWLCIQYEMNILVGGGTGSGKTSFLNAVLLFTPPNQRVVSIEDTRELVLPDFLHWTPMVTRQPNTEGKGEITMLDLMINSLRMRPDRIVLGETRRQREAEVLFEAMHTGHSVLSTFHAEDVFQLKNRLIHAPVNIPELLLSAINLVVIQYRQRRTGFRRTFEIAEFLEEEDKVSANVLYRWNPQQDELEKVGESIKLYSTLSLYTGMTPKEIHGELKERQSVLEYMLKHRIFGVNEVGRIVAWYYRDKKRLINVVENDEEPNKLLEPEETGKEEEENQPMENQKKKKEVHAPKKESKDSIRKKLKAILGEK
ncbi:type II/IV secretion system ATPase subunit [Candidatus Micrarchaeota archaeon]|nr:type II/IV secretion system ATPase subunit [Candidatus Micrarchaeota archaeon]